ncbi:SIR2 family protein [Halopseudomonas aestusnigri]|uniref:SIR2-like domain-containing protein n=1 Tax=Halopseudomonas aestusnigri TaxID=857252 RepID=A0AAQ1GA13_9GAMM|nr:SIR2 family protein [Halopseudomonas aestusnigri]OWL84038.1 SIR2 family protein [Halopseudomonas aestusnigri]SEG72138.1 SIR2-like domain-containing protein [Halopseudomonas aestusnigri]
METFHNPDRFMSDLRQVLSQGRKRIGILVGAGAPLAIRVNEKNEMDPNGGSLIPGVETLTVQATAGLSEIQKAAVDAIKESLDNSANIESILSRIRLLEQALGKTVVQGLDSDGYRTLGKDICKNIAKIVGVYLPKDRNAYSDLIAWITGTVRSNSVEIFTTNYDLLFEEAFERVRSPYFDGFSGGSKPFFDPVSVAGDDLPARWAKLWKMHGSLGWALEDGTVVRGHGREAAELVYPDHLKYDLTQKQPYSALFERLKRFILTPDSLLLAIGFSFRDAHICAVLDESLAMNANSAVLAFQYQELAKEEPAVKLASDRPNLSVYAADGAVIGGVPGKWRPGELPKNWGSIRESFWAPRWPNEPDLFLLGDFAAFARFCALAQANDLITQSLKRDEPEKLETEDGSYDDNTVAHGDDDR